MQYTPDRITSLKPNEIFVFGSNLLGHHMGGAARIALEKFGAIYGQGVGLQGNSYAIPTMQGGVETIKPYVDEFIDFAGQHPELTRVITKNYKLMFRKTLRDRNQHVLGYIDTELSGRQCLRDSNNHVLGYYEPSRDQTVDSNYHVIGNGNLLTTLL